jgi:hypothetical protein
MPWLAAWQSPTVERNGIGQMPDRPGVIQAAVPAVIGQLAG